MNTFFIDLLNFISFPFFHSDNLLIFIPTLSLTICFMFGVIRYLMGGVYR